MIINVYSIFSYPTGPQENRLKAAHVTYKEKKLRKKSKDINMGRKPTHIKFDDDGNMVMPEGKNKILSRVKDFLTELPKDNSTASVEDETDEKSKCIPTGESITSTPSDSTKPVEGACSGLVADVHVQKDAGSSSAVLAQGSCEGDTEEETIVEEEEEDHIEVQMTKSAKQRRRRKRRKGKLPPAEIADNPELMKYWAQRYRLFSRYDDGIQLDRGNLKTPNTLKFICFLSITYINE